MLEICNLSCRIAGKGVLEDINLKIPKNTVTALVGKNGSGKSTLVSCITQNRKYSGKIFLKGQELSKVPARQRAQTVSVLPQIFSAPHITVKELVELGRSPYVDIGRRLSENDKKAVNNAIKNIGVTELKHRFVDELSGGERQKAFAAMTMAQDTELLVLDEPTAFMDMAYEKRFLSLVSQICKKQKKTLIVVMHNLSQAVQFADSVAVLNDGKLLYHGKTEKCLELEIIEKVFDVKKYISDGKVFFAAD